MIAWVTRGHIIYTPPTAEARRDLQEGFAFFLIVAVVGGAIGYLAALLFTTWIIGGLALRVLVAGVVGYLVGALMVILRGTLTTPKG